MSTTGAFLAQLRAKGIKVTLEGDQLRVRAPKGALTEDLAVQLREAKPEILAFLAKARDLAGARHTGIEPAPRDAPMPLSFAQQRLWFLTRLASENAAYNLLSAVRFEGPLRVDVLERSIEAIIGRHEILRTRFVQQADAPVQQIEESPLEVLAKRDLSALEHAAREDMLAALIRDEAARPFDLETGPMVRLTLVRLAAESHALVMVMHHIVSDAWSMGIMVRELGALYDAEIRGADAALAPLPIQYADFAVWQRAHLGEARLEAQRAYWISRLRGVPDLLDLPTDKPRPAVQRFNGALVPFTLPGTVRTALETLAKDRGATLFEVLLTLFEILLARYSNSTDIVVGTPSANRTRREIEPLIGFFVNTLVLRTEHAGAMSFSELLARVHETVVGALEHQDLPFDQVVEAVSPKRSRGYNPLFQVMFSLQNTNTETLSLPELTVEPIEVSSETTLFDLNMSLWVEGDGLAGSVSYREDLFEVETVHRLIDHYALVAERIAASPETPLPEITLLTRSERKTVLEAFNDTRTDLPYNRCLHDPVIDQAVKTPEAAALIFDGEEAPITYAALIEKVDHLAARLVVRGVGPEVMVALVMERSAEMVIALLAVLRAGGVYVPVDPDYPVDRLTYILDDTDAALVLTQPHLTDRVPESRTRLSVTPAMLDSPGPRAVALPEIDPEATAYVIYTSGSTGRPNGVVNRHIGVVNRLLWIDRVCMLGPDDRVLQKTPFTFDVSLWEFLWPLSRGAGLVMARPGRHGDPAYLAETVADHGITTLHFVPSMLGAFLNALPERADFSSLVRVFCSGEALTPQLRDRFAEIFDLPLINLYGPTEASIEVTYWCCDREAPRPTVPIGRPIANTRTHIVDRNLQPLPVGIPGELLIGGVCLTRGYLGRPGLTARRFIPDPFGSEQGERLYRSGDLVRYAPGGIIEYMGRIDRQVKVRGFRIEPSEIESRLAEAGAARSVVIARDDRLVAYVVPSADLGDDPAGTLKDALRESLPEYMVPSRFVFLETLPVTPGGKLDTRALPDPEPGDVDRVHTPPSTATEETLAGIWREVLRLERVGRDDNFFDCGGHSLLAVQVVARVREAFDVEVPLAEVFDAQTLARAAERIDRLVEANPGLRLPAIEPIPRDGDMPLSFGQRQLWVFDKMAGPNDAYNVIVALRMDGVVRVPVLERAISATIARHEVLRTAFPARNGRPVQEIHDDLPFALAVVDLSGSIGNREAAARALGLEASGHRFDLGRLPLFRLHLVRLAPGEHLFLLNIHHIIADGWSIGVMVGELAAHYRAFSENEPVALPPLSVQYADFAAWQQGRLRGETLSRMAAFWRTYLEGAPALLELPLDFPRPGVQAYHGEEVPVQLDRITTDALATLCRGTDATLFMAVLAGYATLLGRYSGQRDVVIGTALANRSQMVLEPLIGFFVNTLALRTRFEDNPDFATLLARTRASMHEAYAHQDMPFEKLLEDLGMERNASHSPIFQVMLTWQNVSVDVTSLPELTISGLDSDFATAKHDLHLVLAETEAGIEGSLIFNRDLFARATVARMARHLEALFATVARDAAMRVLDVPLMDTPEREALLLTWNETTPIALPAETVSEMIAARAMAEPEAVALVTPDGAISYEAMNRRANRVADYLSALGLEPDSIVGVCMPRGPELISALLGIWKAGAAYLPIDPDLPPERISWMFQDSGLAALISHVETTDVLPGFELSFLDLLELGGEDDPLADASEDEPSTVLHGDQTAYVIYTSGTTGEPKGVVVHHRGLARYIAWAVEAYEVEAGRGAALHGVIGFDATVTSLWAPLCRGRAVVLVPNGEELIGLADAVVDPEAHSFLKLTPSHLSLL